MDFPVYHVESKTFDLSDGNVSAIKTYLEESISKGYEGLMLKICDENTSYDSNSRTQWAKLKKNSIQSDISDSLDLVPIAA